MADLTPSDIAAINGNDGFGGGNAIWLFALLILFGMGGNGFGFGNSNRAASVEDLNAQTNASRIESMIQNNGNLTETKFDGLTKGLCDGFYNNAMQINGLEKNLTTQIQALSSKMDAEKIASLQSQVNNLTMQATINQATCGMVKYPMSASYSAPNPFCNCNNNCSNI